MNPTATILCIIAVSATALSAAPDFPQHNFSSTIPDAIKWELKQQLDDAEHDTVVRAYTNAESGRSIVLLIGKNNTSERDLGSFADRYMAQIKQKPGFKVRSESSGLLDEIPSRTLVADVLLPTGQIQHIMWIVAIQRDKLYTCTFGSTQKAVEDDEVLRAYLKSIRISKKEKAEPDARANGPKRPWLILNVRQKA